MSKRHPHPDQPLYPEVMLRPVPFPLPPEFLHQLGYDRAVASFRPVHADNDGHPRRFAALWWDSEANQLGWSDGLRSGAGQLDGQAWLAWLHGGGFLGLVGAWLVEHEVRLDSASSGFPHIGHWLLVDGSENRVWVGTRGLVARSSVDNSSSRRRPSLPRWMRSPIIRRSPISTGRSVAAPPAGPPLNS